ncbi:helix-turn-helix domain-containing protein [Erythrobacter sp. HL-111]|uniref:helix-turn-helix domain-containing protein n=1 Tax=Erythrobacter sp. HL-111 TaxID=1798193 RepID=UPI0006D974D1|nr:helix-turn-helix domain-containing protein [Erythrobacter sp. HL-111]KPP91163.1 MAG: Transcriptional activator of acetoin/glycerol metabolism [Erythrobacteraceae bacterium HL-111]SDS44979.1 regulatory protein, Fis family [Erythrobacter sp. HL-111]
MEDQHAQLVREAISSDAAAGRSTLAASWCRSALHHGLDPAKGPAADRLDASRLALAREAHEELLLHAGPVLDRIARTLVRSGRCILLTDSESLILEERMASGDRDHFDRARLVAGECWSEAAEGTNGIGTCIADEKPVIIHRDQHFLSANVQVSCHGVPICDAVGNLVAALDVSTNRYDHDRDTAALIMNVLMDAAQELERLLFGAAYRDCRIVHLDDADSPGALVAVDRDDLVVGANRSARRRALLAKVSAEAPVPVADLFGPPEEDPIAAAERRVLRQALARSHGNVAAAARLLGIGRATFYRRMTRAGLAA